MRTRGRWTAYLDGASAPGLAVLVSVGMIVVPEGTGTTVLQSPFTDPNANWFFYDEALVGYEESVNDVIDIPGLAIFRGEIDTKAMRIAVPDTEVQFVIEATTVSGAKTLNVHAHGRMLLGQ